MDRRQLFRKAYRFFMRSYEGRHIEEEEVNPEENGQIQEETTEESPAQPAGEEATAEQAEEEAPPPDPVDVELPMPTLLQPAKTAADILQAGAVEVQNALASAATARAAIASADVHIHDAEMALEEARTAKNKAAAAQVSTLENAQASVDEQIGRLQRQSERLGNEIAALAG